MSPPRKMAGTPIKRFDVAELKPLTDEERKILFPNGPVSLKQLKQSKLLNRKIYDNEKTSS